MELFLTLSCNFPFVVKAEFKDLANAAKYLKLIRRHSKRAGQTSTLVAWRDKELIEGIDFTQVSSAPVLFKLLIQVKEGLRDRGGSGAGCPAMVSMILDRLRTEVGIEDQWSLHGLFSYWDYGWFLRTRNISKLLKFIADDLTKDDEIIRLALVPVWEETKQSSPRPPKDTKEEDQEPDPDELDHWGGIKPWVWCQPFASLSASLEDSNFLAVPGEHAYNFQLDHLRKRFLWLLACVGQMKRSWTSPPFVSRTHDSPSSFDLLAAKIRDDHLKKLAEASEPSWDLIEKQKNNFAGLHRKLLLINTEYNERIRGHQVILLNEHFVHMGEYNGAMDMVHGACERLFRHYCSYPNPLSTMETGGEVPKWRGLSISTSSSVLSVDLENQLLFIPAAVKFSCEDMLTIISHEAAHQALYWICSTMDLSRGAYHHFKAEISDPFLSAIEQLPFVQTRLRPADLRYAYQGPRKHYWQALDKDDPATWGLSSNEWLCDVVALLASGPAYLRGFVHHLFRPSLNQTTLDKYEDDKKNSSPFLHHREKYPPHWLRIESLRFICEKLGWLKEDVFHLDEMVRAHFSSYETEFALAESIDDDAAMVRLFGLLADKKRLPREALYYLALRQDQTMLWRLLRWCQVHGAHFLYYPFPVEKGQRGDHDQARAIAAAKQAYPWAIRYVNQRVGGIADRMMFNDEVILEHPLKYIVAASMLPEHNHAHYCMGRLIQSIYHSDTYDDGFIEDMSEAMEKDLGMKFEY